MGKSVTLQSCLIHWHSRKPTFASDGVTEALLILSQFSELPMLADRSNLVHSCMSSCINLSTSSSQHSNLEIK